MPPSLGGTARCSEDGEVGGTQGRRQTLAEQSILEAAAGERHLRDAPAATLAGQAGDGERAVDQRLVEARGDPGGRLAAGAVGEERRDQRPPVELVEGGARDLSGREAAGRNRLRPAAAGSCRTPPPWRRTRAPSPPRPRRRRGPPGPRSRRLRPAPRRRRRAGPWRRSRGSSIRSRASGSSPPARSPRRWRGRECRAARGPRRLRAGAAGRARCAAARAPPPRRRAGGRGAGGRAGRTPRPAQRRSLRTSAPGAGQRLRQ